MIQEGQKIMLNLRVPFRLGFESFVKSWLDNRYLNSAFLLTLFPGGSDGTESACDSGDPGLMPGLGRSPGEGNGYPLQSSCLENSMDKGAWLAIVHGLQRVGHD